MIVNSYVFEAEEIPQKLALFAVEALLEELHLTPKPGLVDRKNNGTHRDLTLQLMGISAYTLQDCFYDMAVAATGKQPSQQLRERLAAIGRYGEQKMMKATGDVNTHKGAIWTLGLLTGAAGILLSQPGDFAITRNHFLLTAGAIAAFEDRHMPPQNTNGCKMRKKYKVRSAREEAMECFPALQQVALPAWDKYKYEPENIRRLNVLLSLMSVVDDTCILYRSNIDVLYEVQHRAGAIMQQGGLGLYANWHLYVLLDEYITNKWISPGGSADLLAATVFLQKIVHHYKIK